MKEYLEGKIKLKEPTLGDMCKVGELIYRNGPDSLMAGMGLVDLISVVCKTEDGIKINELNPEISKEILKDFFLYWKPLKWISDNMRSLTPSKKSSQKPQKESEAITKP